MALRIKELRKAAGLTQAELAEAAGLDRSQLSKIENEKEPASTRRLSAIARVLDVPVDRLFASDDAGYQARALILSIFDELGENEREAIISHARALAAARKVASEKG